MIEVITTKVYRSTAKGRRYLTKTGAIKAEARSLIEAKHPTERAYFDGNGYMTEPGWNWMEIPRSHVLLRRVCRLVKRAIAP